MSMIIAWFLSKRVRQVIEVCRHVEKLINHQRDLMKPEGAGEVRAAVENVREELRRGKRGKEIDEALGSLEKAANKHLKAYPHPSLRENLEVVLVAITIALAVRTFFLQPFKIPTGSMQPTLYGITHEDFRGQPDVKFPGRLQRFADYWLRGVSYVHVVAEEEGSIRVDRPRTFFPFVKRQIVWVGNKAHPIWFPPEDFERNTGIGGSGWARRGEDIIKARIVTGDHLFVDRLSYNFKRPERGEIVVFETAGIPAIERNSVSPRIPPDQFYIKRLVGLGGESLSIGTNRHVRIDGQELSASTPLFENVYTFSGRVQDSVYSGHAPQGKLFSPQSEFKIRPNHYMVMGDNTYSSLDSRMWGDFPREYMIGKAAFVYWPILGRDKGHDGRFGWGFR